MKKSRLFRTWFRQDFDGVVEAVHYKKTGRIDWVRAYERRGPTWSDHLIIDRKTLLKKLEEGKRFFSGKRIIFNASEFKLGKKLVIDDNGKGEVIITENTKQNLIDHLEDVEIL